MRTIFFMVGCLFLQFFPTPAAAQLIIPFEDFVDSIHNSRPSAPTNHTISFSPKNPIPEGESFEVAFDYNEKLFDLSSVTYTDIDAYLNGNPVILGPSCFNNEDWKVTFSTIQDNIQFDVCIGAGASVSAYDDIEILVGDHTTNGVNQIINPPYTGSYPVAVSHNNYHAATYVAVVNGVGLYASVHPQFTFMVSGVAQGTDLGNQMSDCEESVDDGFVDSATSVATSPVQIPWGQVARNTSKCAAHEVAVSTNSNHGFSVNVIKAQDLVSQTGDQIKTFTNDANPGTPQSWIEPIGDGADPQTWGHMGLTSTDDTLGTGDIFGDALFGEIPDQVDDSGQVLFHNGPTNGEINGIGKAMVGYKIEVSDQQPGGTYQSEIMYVATPTFGGYSTIPPQDQGDNAPELSSITAGVSPDPVITTVNNLSQGDTFITVEIGTDIQGAVACVFDTTVYTNAADILNHDDVQSVFVATNTNENLFFSPLMDAGNYTLSCTTSSALNNNIYYWTNPVQPLSANINGFTPQGKILIAGNPGSTQTNTVVLILKQTYDPNDLTALDSRITQLPHGIGAQLLLDYASANGVELIIQSTTGINAVNSISEKYWPYITYVMPLGADSSVEETSPNAVVSVVSGCAGDATNGCQTAYGDGLEFWDDDTLTGSSNIYSNPVIAAKLLKVKEGRGNDWWDARYHARRTAVRTAITHPASNSWNKNNGFGQIDVNAAIASTDPTPANPL